jgi:hypothetical protein
MESQQQQHSAGTSPERQGYNYALVHQSPGMPNSGIGTGVYQLEGDKMDAHSLSTPIVLNTKTQNDSLVTEGLLLRLTDCDNLRDIRVISLRNKELTSCLRMLA